MNAQTDAHSNLGVPCPYCGYDDQTEQLALITDDVMEWICQRCGLTWNVDESHEGGK
jgi:transposase-like protein